MSHTIFISFSSENQLQAERVCNYLEQNGVKCWISSRDCRDSHMTAIPDAIEACKYLVLIASPQSAESPWVPDEINLAKTKKKILVPFDIVKFEYPKEWWMLGTSQRINAYSDFDNALMQLLERVGGQVKASNQGTTKNSEIKSFSSCQDNVTEVKKSNKIDASKVEEVNHDLKMKQENDESTEILLKAAEEGDAKTKTILSCSNPFEMVIKSKTYHEIGVSTNVRGYIKAGSISVGDLVSVGDSLKTGIVDKISKVTIEKQYSSSLYGAPDIIHKKSIEIAGAEDGEVELIIRIPPNDICVNDVLHLREKAYAKTIESKNKIKVGTIMLKSANSGRNIFEVLNGKLKPGYYISSLGRVGKIIDYFSNSEILILNQGCTAFVSFERNSSVSTYSGQTFDILI